MKILVTGATGAVGPAVVSLLHHSGHEVRTFSLDARAAPPPQAGIETMEGDICDPEAVGEAMKGVAGVVHLAALLHMVNPAPELWPRYEQVNVDGTRNVVAAARREGVSRLVFFSTISVYGASAGGVLTEESPPRPDSFYGRSKLAAERIVLAAQRRDGEPPAVVLRLGAVYGPRIKGNYERLLRALARRRFVPIGSGENRRTLVYDKDVARAALTALEHPHAAGKVFNVSDGEFHTMKDIVSVMCEALGRKPPRVSLPVGPTLRLVGIVERGGHRIRGTRSRILANSGQAPSATTPLTLRAMIEKYIEDIAVDSRRIQNDLGFKPLYDLATGWQETIQEMRRVGEL